MGISYESQSKTVKGPADLQSVPVIWYFCQLYILHITLRYVCSSALRHVIFVLIARRVIFDKEVFVKQWQAPTAPKLEGVCFFF